MQIKHFLIVATIAANWLAGSAMAVAYSAAERQLAEQGHYWQQRDAKRAAEAWSRLLLTQRDHPEALLGLGRLAIEAGQITKAHAYLAQFKKAHPEHPDVALLEQEIDFASEEAVAALNQARIFLRQDNVPEAVKIYRRLFKGRRPQGKLGAEYYSALGYTKEGWGEAVQGLERLYAEAPKNSQFSLNLASLLVLRNETRVRGLKMLTELSRHPDIGGVATEQWRSVLTWLGAPPPAAMAPFFEQYLKANPEDEEIRQQYRAKRSAPPAAEASSSGKGTAGSAPPRPVVRIDPFGAHIKTGYEALQGSELDGAERAFEAALRLKPQHPSALGGLGLVRLRQERFGQARELLEQAAARGDAQDWREALDSARYWAWVEQARQARQKDMFDDAAQLLEQAVSLRPDEITALLELAQTYVSLQSFPDAERVFRAVLEREPDNLPALQGLVGVLSAQGRGAQALELIDNLAPAVREHIDAGRLRAERSIAQARSAVALGEWAQAQSYFEDALSYSPQDVWLRLELARVLQELKQPAQALRVIDDLLALQGANPEPEALYVAALLRAEQQQWPQALELVGRIEPTQRSKDMQSLHSRATLQVELARAHALIERGELAQARATLTPLHERIGNDVGMLGVLAAAHVQAGEPQRARALLRELMVREPAPGAGVLLQYAGLLLQLGDTHAEFQSAMHSLRALHLNEEQQRLYANLERGHGLRQSEDLRKRGALAQAYEALRPLLISHPEDPLVLGTLARMYVDAGRVLEAAQIYQRILARTPDDLDTLRAAGQAAAASGALDAAEAIYLHALDLMPDDPQLLAALGGLYRQQGRDGKALPLLRRAQEQLQHQLIAQQAPAPPIHRHRAGQTGPSAWSADNPFAASPVLLKSTSPPSTPGSGTRRISAQ